MTPEAQTQLVGYLLNYGILGLFTLFVGYLIYCYVPRLVNAHISLIETLRENDTVKVKSEAIHAEACRGIDDTLKLMITKSSNAALKHAARGAMHAIQSGDPLHAIPYLEKAIELLE